MLLDEVVSVSEGLAGTSRRLSKIDLLASLLSRLSGDEIPIAVNYLSGVLRQGRIGVGPARLFRLQAAAAALPTLSLHEVDAAFDAIAADSGAGSQERRRAALAALFQKATRREQDFLIRITLGELRQGALEGVMEEGVARAAGIPVGELRRAAMVAGDLAPVAGALLTRGREGLSAFTLTLFKPVAPMLAQPAADLEEALARLGEADLQWKLDGARVQLHKEGDRVRVYSRNLNDVTDAVPELVEGAREFAAQSLILDGEALALRSDGSPHPFQTTMRRFGRRLGVAEQRRSYPLSPFYFDCLYHDGESLIALPERVRFARLAEVLPPEVVIPRLVTADPARGAQFLAELLELGHEGVMAKAGDFPYEAGRRGYGWLKVKPVQTLDLVILAAEWGHGRRQGTLSNLHLGARDEHGGFVMLGKTFKGLTDAMLAWQTARLLELEVSRDAGTVYVKPELVVEIAFSDIQASPRYPGGFALRFARVKRYRPDKEPAEADTMATIRALFRGRSER
ncbi:ATP-dependent DNA ligase [Geomesophilobacter sediminis]|uniref:Probable DNA ligase n=1 Tax=Geomesophilobacter sediminis TaxID=2798584 RepID=A0A8J7LZA6_9BACT|nr:ATP-dependent DNA ligase [Geomesophilobacter sediminis]MBJ6726076.1 ATP-dependent DNA ligase [Geomesophilobacter sediminis]